MYTHARGYEADFSIAEQQVQLSRDYLEPLKGIRGSEDGQPSLEVEHDATTLSAGDTQIESLETQLKCLHFADYYYSQYSPVEHVADINQVHKATVGHFLKTGYVDPEQVATVVGFLTHCLGHPTDPLLNLNSTEIQQLSAVHKALTQVDEQVCHDYTQDRQALLDELGVTNKEVHYRDQAVKFHYQTKTMASFSEALLKEMQLDLNSSEVDIAHAITEGVRDFVTYKQELGREDVWQSLEQTLEQKTGDCEDMAILLTATLSYVFHHKLGYSKKDVSNRFFLAAGTMQLPNKAQANHALTKAVLKDETGKKISFYIDATAKSGPILADALAFTEKFQMNDINFIAHEAIDADFSTASNMGSLFDLSLKDPDLYGVAEDSPYYQNVLAVTGRSPGEIKAAYDKNKNTMIWHINDAVMKLNHFAMQDLKVPKTFEGSLYREVLLDEIKDGIKIVGEGGYNQSLGVSGDKIEIDRFTKSGEKYIAANNKVIKKTAGITESKFIVPNLDEPPKNLEASKKDLIWVSKLPTSKMNESGWLTFNAVDQILRQEKLELKDNDKAAFFERLKAAGFMTTTFKSPTTGVVIDYSKDKAFDGNYPNIGQYKFSEAGELVLKKPEKEGGIDLKSAVVQGLQYWTQNGLSREDAQIMQKLLKPTNKGPIGKNATYNDKVPSLSAGMWGINTGAQLQAIKPESDPRVPPDSSSIKFEEAAKYTRDDGNGVLVKATESDVHNYALHLERLKDGKIGSSKVNTIYRKIDESIFTKEQISGEYKSFITVGGKKYETPYKFFDILTSKISNLKEERVTGLVLNEKAVFNLTYSIRSQLNKLLMLFHIVNGVQELLLNQARELHDLNMDEVTKQAVDDIRRKSDGQFDKFNRQLTSFQSQLNEGIDSLCGEITSYVKSINDAMQEKKKVNIDAWARTIDENPGKPSVTAFVGNFLLGGVTDLIDEYTGVFTYERNKMQEQVNHFFTKITAVNTFRSNKLINYLISGKINGAIRQGGIDLWDTKQTTGSDWLSQSEENKERLIDNFGKLAINSVAASHSSSPASIVLPSEQLARNEQRAEPGVDQQEQGGSLNIDLMKEKAFYEGKGFLNNYLNSLATGDIQFYETGAQTGKIKRVTTGIGMGGSLFAVMQQILGPSQLELANSFKEDTASGVKDKALRDKFSINSTSLSQGNLLSLDEGSFPFDIITSRPQQGHSATADKAMDFISNIFGIKLLELAVQKIVDGMSNDAMSIRGDNLFANYNVEMQAEFRKRMYYFQATLQTAMVVYQSIAKAKLEAAEEFSKELGIKRTSSSKAIMSIVHQAMSTEFNQINTAVSAFQDHMRSYENTINELTKARLDRYKSTVQRAMKISRTAIQASIVIASNLPKVTIPAAISAAAANVLVPPTQVAGITAISAGYADPALYHAMFATFGSYLSEFTMSTIQYVFDKGSLVSQNPYILANPIESNRDINAQEYTRYNFKKTDEIQSGYSYSKTKQQINILEDSLPQNNLENFEHLHALAKYTPLGLYKARSRFSQMNNSFEWRPQGNYSDANEVHKVPGAIDSEVSFLANTGDGTYQKSGVFTTHAESLKSFDMMLLRHELLFIKMVATALENAAASLVGKNAQDAYEKLHSGGFSLLERALVRENELVNDFKQDIERFKNAWNYNIGQQKALRDQEVEKTFSGFQSVVAGFIFLNPGWNIGNAAIEGIELSLETSKMAYKRTLSYSGYHSNYKKLNEDTVEKIKKSNALFSAREKKIEANGSAYSRERYIEFSRNEIAEPTSRNDLNGIARQKIEKTLNQDIDQFRNLLNSEKVFYSDDRGETIKEESFSTELAADPANMKAVSPVAAIKLRDNITGTFVERILIMMIENARYAAMINETRAVTGVSSSASILQTTTNIVNQYNDLQLNTMENLIEECKNRVDSHNTHTKENLEFITDMSVQSAIAALSAVQYIKFGDSLFGGDPKTWKESAMQFSRSIAKGLLRTIIEFSTQMAILLGTLNAVSTFDAKLLSNKENTEEASKEEEADKQEETKLTREEKIQEHEKQVDNLAHQKSTPSIKDSITFTSRGQFVVNKSVMAKAKSAVKKRFRTIKLLQKLKDKENEARQDIISEITGVQKSGAGAAIGSVIGAYEQSEIARIDKVSSAADSIANLMNQNMQALKSVVQKIVGNTVQAAMKSLLKKEDKKEGGKKRYKGLAAIGKRIGGVKKKIGDSLSRFGKTNFPETSKRLAATGKTIGRAVAKGKESLGAIHPKSLIRGFEPRLYPTEAKNAKLRLSKNAKKEMDRSGEKLRDHMKNVWTPLASMWMSDKLIAQGVAGAEFGLTEQDENLHSEELGSLDTAEGDSVEDGHKAEDVESLQGTLQSMGIGGTEDIENATLLAQILKANQQILLTELREDTETAAIFKKYLKDKVDAVIKPKVTLTQLAHIKNYEQEGKDYEKKIRKQLFGSNFGREADRIRATQAEQLGDNNQQFKQRLAREFGKDSKTFQGIIESAKNSDDLISKLKTDRATLEKMIDNANASTVDDKGKFMGLVTQVGETNKTKTRNFIRVFNKMDTAGEKIDKLLSFYQGTNKEEVEGGNITIRRTAGDSDDRRKKSLGLGTKDLLNVATGGLANVLPFRIALLPITMLGDALGSKFAKGVSEIGRTVYNKLGKKGKQFIDSIRNAPADFNKGIREGFLSSGEKKIRFKDYKDTADSADSAPTPKLNPGKKENPDSARFLRRGFRILGGLPGGVKKIGDSANKIFSDMAQGDKLYKRRLGKGALAVAKAPAFLAKGLAYVLYMSLALVNELIGEGGDGLLGFGKLATETHRDAIRGIWGDKKGEQKNDIAPELKGNQKTASSEVSEPLPKPATKKEINDNADLPPKPATQEKGKIDKVGEVGKAGEAEKTGEAGKLGGVDQPKSPKKISGDQPRAPEKKDENIAPAINAGQESSDIELDTQRRDNKDIIRFLREEDATDYGSKSWIGSLFGAIPSLFDLDLFSSRGLFGASKKTNEDAFYKQGLTDRKIKLFQKELGVLREDEQAKTSTFFYVDNPMVKNGLPPKLKPTTVDKDRNKEVDKMTVGKQKELVLQKLVENKGDLSSELFKQLSEKAKDTQNDIVADFDKNKTDFKLKSNIEKRMSFVQQVTRHAFSLVDGRDSKEFAPKLANRQTDKGELSAKFLMRILRTKTSEADKPVSGSESGPPKPAEDKETKSPPKPAKNQKNREGDIAAPVAPRQGLPSDEKVIEEIGKDIQEDKGSKEDLAIENLNLIEEVLDTMQDINFESYSATITQMMEQAKGDSDLQTKLMKIHTRITNANARNIGDLSTIDEIKDLETRNKLVGEGRIGSMIVSEFDERSENRMRIGKKGDMLKLSDTLEEKKEAGIKETRKLEQKKADEQRFEENRTMKIREDLKDKVLEKTKKELIKELNGRIQENTANLEAAETEVNDSIKTNDRLVSIRKRQDAIKADELRLAIIKQNDDLEVMNEELDTLNKLEEAVTQAEDVESILESLEEDVQKEKKEEIKKLQKDIKKAKEEIRKKRDKVAKNIAAQEDKQKGEIKEVKERIEELDREIEENLENKIRKGLMAIVPIVTETINNAKSNERKEEIRKVAGVVGEGLASSLIAGITGDDARDKLVSAALDSIEGLTKPEPHAKSSKSEEMVEGFVKTLVQKGEKGIQEARISGDTPKAKAIANLIGQAVTKSGMSQAAIQNQSDDTGDIKGTLDGLAQRMPGLQSDIQTLKQTITSLSKNAFIRLNLTDLEHGGINMGEEENDMEKTAKAMKLKEMEIVVTKLERDVKLKLDPAKFESLSDQEKQDYVQLDSVLKRVRDEYINAQQREIAEQVTQYAKRAMAGETLTPPTPADIQRCVAELARHLGNVTSNQEEEQQILARLNDDIAAVATGQKSSDSLLQALPVYRAHCPSVGASTHQLLHHFTMLMMIQENLDHVRSRLLRSFLQLASRKQCIEMLKPSLNAQKVKQIAAVLKQPTNRHDSPAQHARENVLCFLSVYGVLNDDDKQKLGELAPEALMALVDSLLIGETQAARKLWSIVKGFLPQEMQGFESLLQWAYDEQPVPKVKWLTLEQQTKLQQLKDACSTKAITQKSPVSAFYLTLRRWYQPVRYLNELEHYTKETVNGRDTSLRPVIYRDLELKQVFANFHSLDQGESMSDAWFSHLFKLSNEHQMQALELLYVTDQSPNKVYMMSKFKSLQKRHNLDRLYTVCSSVRSMVLTEKQQQQLRLCLHEAATYVGQKVSRSITQLYRYAKDIQQRRKEQQSIIEPIRQSCIEWQALNSLLTLENRSSEYEELIPHIRTLPHPNQSSKYVDLLIQLSELLQPELNELEQVIRTLRGSDKASTPAKVKEKDMFKASELLLAQHEKIKEAPVSLKKFEALLRMKDECERFYHHDIGDVDQVIQEELDTLIATVLGQAGAGLSLQSIEEQVRVIDAGKQQGNTLHRAALCYVIRNRFDEVNANAAHVIDMILKWTPVSKVEHNSIEYLKEERLKVDVIADIKSLSTSPVMLQRMFTSARTVSASCDAIETALEAVKTDKEKRELVSHLFVKVPRYIHDSGSLLIDFLAAKSHNYGSTLNQTVKKILKHARS